MAEFEYYQVEDELVSRVQTKITESSLNIEVAAYPDSEEEYKRAVSKPRILIGFVGAVLDNKTTNENAGEETLTIVALIQARRKKGDEGCHHIAKLLRKWLAGFETSHCGRLMYKSYKGNDLVYDADSGIWNWDMEFECKKMFIQDPEPDGPLLTQVIINDEIQTP